MGLDITPSSGELGRIHVANGAGCSRISSDLRPSRGSLELQELCQELEAFQPHGPGTSAAVELELPVAQGTGEAARV